MKNLKRIVALFLLSAMLITVFATGFSASAANNSEIDKLNNQISTLKKRINENKNNLSKQNDVKKDLDARITAIQKKISLVNSQISTTKRDIARSEAKIRDKNAEIADKKEQFKRRLRSLYMSNTGSSLQVLLGAESFDDLLARAQVTKRITAQDDKNINELMSVIAEINAEIKKNNARKAQLEKDKAQLAADKAELNNDIAEVNGVISKINKDITADQKEVKSLNKYLDSLLYDNTEVDIDFAGKFTWPVPGQYRISCVFGSNDPWHRSGGGHNGLDIAAPMNSRIVAAAKGQVSKVYNGCSHNYGKNYSCGCAGGLGNHVRISHGNYGGQSYLTIYGHMTTVASDIRSGMMVNQGHTIGYVGSTGYSTGYHLHFGVATATKNGSPGTYLNPQRFL